MRCRRLRFARGFRVAMSNRRCQAAAMAIAPGGSEGDPDNRHAGADQWLFVVAGSGVAWVNGIVPTSLDSPAQAQLSSRG